MTTRLVIETEGAKGRSFSALALTRVYAPCVWETGIREHGRHRPALMLLAAAAEEAGAVVANLREGRKMRLFGSGVDQKGEPCDVLRSERFSITTQRTDEGTLILVRHPEIFTFSPGLVGDDVRFVCLPPWRRIEEEARRFDLAATQTHLQRCGFEPWSEEEQQRRSWGRSKATTRLVPDIESAHFPAFAALLVAGVAQRVGYPILDDPLFWAQFAAALLAEGLAFRSPERTYGEEIAEYAEVGAAESGYFPGAAVAASQAAIGAVLARETATFLRPERCLSTAASRSSSTSRG